MSRITDLSAAVFTGRHCNKSDCEKCRARFRWMRRKAWRSRKPASTRIRGRKEVMPK